MNIKHILNKHRLEAFVVLFLIVVATLYFSGVARAVNGPSGGYIAPAILDPTCTPGAIDCFVNPFVVGEDGVDEGSEVARAAMGSIPFFWRDTDDDGVYELTEDNNNLYWHDELNRLGIGTAIPGARLDIKGFGTGTDLIFRIKNGIEEDIFAIFDDKRVGIMDLNPDGIFEVNPDGVEDNGDEFVIKSNGDVGIGDISPDARLEIVGVPGVAPGPFMISNTESGDGDWFTVTNIGKVGIGDASPDGLLEVAGSSSGPSISLFIVSSTEAGDGDILTIESSGRVGIGISNPGSLFSIVGLPTNPVATGGIGAGKGVICIDSAGNLFVDDDGTVDCL